MFGRFACLASVIVAALTPAFAPAQSYDPHMPPPYSVQGPQYGSPVMGGDGAHTYGRTRYTELPDDLGFAYGDTQFERFLKETFRHAFFRLEYLNWNIKDPGNVVLGAPILSPIIDPNNVFQNTRIPFEIFDQGTSLGDGPLAGFGVSPTLDGIRGKNNNGIRGTFGFNFEPFSVEASVFALQTMRGTAKTGDLPVTLITSTDLLGNPLPDVNFGTFVVQGTLVNGQPSRTSYLIYDEAYQASIRSSVWGADSKIVLASLDSGGPFTFQPLFGIKFLNFNERLDQLGAYRDPLVTGTNVQTRRINSATQNYLYGPQLGARIELGNQYLKFGFEPKMMFGVNSYRSTLHVENARTNNLVANITQDLRETDTTFGPVADLQVYGRGRINDHVSVFVAYNLLWAGLITRPADNIVYNVDQTGQSAFSQDIRATDLVLQGVSVGGEVSW